MACFTRAFVSFSSGRARARLFCLLQLQRGFLEYLRPLIVLLKKEKKNGRKNNISFDMLQNMIFYEKFIFLKNGIVKIS